MARLSVNLNKIALLRNSRRTGVPDLLPFVGLAREAGARGITLHPRPDERHVRRSDVTAIAGLMAPWRPAFELNLEGYPDERFLDIVREVRPEQCTLVPDGPGVLTSDKGWDLDPAEEALVRPALEVLQGWGCRVILFIDPDPSMPERIAEIGADGVETYTGSYAEAFRRGDHTDLADQVSGYFVPAVIGVAVSAFIAWAIWGPEPQFSYGLVAAVAVLIIACPCALGLATPMSIMVGVGRGAGAGVLIKNAEALEHMEKIDTLVVDKTGTLTAGKPAVTAIVPAAGFTEAEVLRLTANVERASEHPLALAIVAAAEKQGMPTGPVADFDSPTGKGARGTVEGRRIVLGNKAFLAEHGIDIAPLAEQADRLREDGATAIFAGIDGRVAGAIAIADPVKASTPEALASIKAEGIRVVMLTGDNWTTAKAVARRLGIDEVEAEVLPDQKSAVVDKFKRAGRVVAMAGDGVNDAPALAAADVGIAMGTGTDVAMESAGVTLLKGDLTGIVRARRLSQATMRNIRQNLFFAVIYNALGVPVAAGVLYPFFGILLSPIIAAAAMALSSVSVIGNALRLRRVRL